MAQKTTKTILVIVFFITVTGAAIGYFLYNKGPLDVKNSSAINVTATELYSAFHSDSTAALIKFAGKVLLVNGKVNAVSVNQQKEKIILLITGTEAAYINCTMEKESENISVNKELTIKGICSGIGQGDAELGIQGDVYLTRCFLVK